MAKQQNSTKRSLLLVLGGILVIFGIYKLIQRLLSPWWPAISQVMNTIIGIAWPLAVILAGIFVIYAVKKGTITTSTGKKLYRKREGRMIGGVCAGLADFFGVDPAIVRIVAVILMFASFFAFMVFYIVLWIIIPEEPVNSSSWV